MRITVEYRSIEHFFDIFISFYTRDVRGIKRLSASSRCSVDTAERIELISDTKAFFDYPTLCFKEFRVSPK